MPRASLEMAADLGGAPEPVAVVALSGDRVVGEARYLMHGDGRCELGIAVADDCQGSGIGHDLLDLLRREAAANGVTTLQALVRVDNVRMLRTLRSTGSVIVEPPEDMVIVAEVSCVDSMPSWPSAAAGRRVLVEHCSLWPDAATTALREAGFDVRQCLGPTPGRQICPLLRTGRCPLADQADVVACLLSKDDPRCRAVARDHALRRRDRLVATSSAEWREAAVRLIRRR